MQYRMIYPDDRPITHKEIETWYSDAVANDEIDQYLYSGCTAIADMVKALNDAGNVSIIEQPSSDDSSDCYYGPLATRWPSEGGYDY